MSAVRIGALYIHPVKACAATARDEAALGPLGLEHDRRFAFVDAEGRALTQRAQPLLATVRPALDADALRLDFGGLVQIRVPFDAFVEGTSADVWGKRIPARAADGTLTEPAAEYLGSAVRLVTLDPAAQRAFVDSQPVLVTMTAALASLNRLLPSGVGMERFRPNVVVDGVETGWKTLRSKDVILEWARPCGRCEVTTIDQASGARMGDEPLRTLTARFGGNFGAYCRVTRSGRLRVGEVLQAA